MIDDQAPYRNVINMPKKGTRALRTIRGDDFAGKPVRDRLFHVADLIPGNTVTTLNGDGGTGKSLLALQLASATVVGSSWCNLPVTAGACVYLSAEDDEDELHRRLVAIANSENVGLDRLRDLHIVPLAGEDALLAVPDARGNILKPTPLFAALERLIADVAPVLIVLDTLADIYGGEENQRAQARQFIGLLRGWSIRYQMATLLLAHPSLAGMSSGTGSSGSTAWNNSVRSRLYLDRVRGDDGSESDPDLRVLRTVKANYGRTGGEIRLRWDNGILQALDQPQATAFGAIAAQAKADQTFLDLLDELATTGRYVSPYPTSHNYGPTIMARQPSAAGINRNGFDAAMQRLFTARLIKIEKSPGPPSRQTDVLVRVR